MDPRRDRLPAGPKPRASTSRAVPPSRRLAGLLLAGLLPLTGVWPSAATGAWVLPVAAWTSLAPPAVVLASLLSAFVPRAVRRPARRDAS
jgi:hypothetical protein